MDGWQVGEDNGGWWSVGWPEGKEAPSRDLSIRNVPLHIYLAQIPKTSAFSWDGGNTLSQTAPTPRSQAELKMPKDKSHPLKMHNLPKLSPTQWKGATNMVGSKTQDTIPRLEMFWPFLGMNWPLPSPWSEVSFGKRSIYWSCDESPPIEGVSPGREGRPPPASVTADPSTMQSTLDLGDPTQLLPR